MRATTAQALRAFVELLDGQTEPLHPVAWQVELAQAKAALLAEPVSPQEAHHRCARCGHSWVSQFVTAEYCGDCHRAVQAVSPQGTGEALLDSMRTFYGLPPDATVKDFLAKASKPSHIVAIREAREPAPDPTAALRALEQKIRAHVKERAPQTPWINDRRCLAWADEIAALLAPSTEPT